MAIFCERLVRGESLKINARHSEGDDGCVRDYVFVDDVVRANVLAAEGELDSATFNVGTGVGTTTRALSEAIATALGVHAELGFSPHREGDLERSVLRPNATLARAYEATSLAEGIARTAEWFEERANVGR